MSNRSYLTKALQTNCLPAHSGECQNGKWNESCPVTSEAATNVKSLLEIFFSPLVYSKRRLTLPSLLGQPRLGLIALTAMVACSPPQEIESEEGIVVSPDAAADSVSDPMSTPDAGADDGMQTASAGQPSAATDAGSPGYDLSEDSPSDAPPSDADAGVGGGDDPVVSGPRDAGLAPTPVRTTFGGLTVDTSAKEQDLDLFGAPGHRFWIEVSDIQVNHMNAAVDQDWYDPYQPGIGPTFADHVVVQNAQTLSVADYGKMEVRLIGSSTMRPWSSVTIPNVRIDTNEFQEKLKIGSFEHIRLNNSVVGGIFREQLTNRTYRELGYPAARGSHAFLGSNVWGDDVWVPMTLMEVYKKRFCNDNAGLIGGGESCPNMWEFAGDLAYGFDSLPDDICQLPECDNTRLEEFTTALNETPADAGFKQALDPYISWTHFHQFQCLSWMLWTGDDMLHNANNNLIIEREDGKLVWAPYSVDVSTGQFWHRNTPLTGLTAIPKGCQGDPECWADTILECEILIDKFDDLNPENFVDEAVEQLQSLNLLREGDLEQAGELRDWFLMRQLELPYELEHYRYLKDTAGNCPVGLGPCSDGTCNDECLP